MPKIVSRMHQTGEIADHADTVRGVATEYDRMNKRDLLEKICEGSLPCSIVFEQTKVAILVNATEDLEKSAAALAKTIETAAAASDRLGRKVFWLNVVLAAATVVGAGAAVWALAS